MATSSAELLRVNTAMARTQIASGERPIYHLVAATTADGRTVDVTVRELPIIHQFVPDHDSVPLGGRLLIARTLGVDPNSFDIAPG